MIRIPSESALLETFRPSERDQVLLPEELSLPLEIEDYYAWVEPSGARVYLVFVESGKPLGIVFRRDQTGSGAGAQMCEWCHAVRGGGEVTLLTANASSNRRVGVYACSDLSCKEKALQSPGVDDFQERGSAQDRVRKALQRMAVFARRNIF